MVCCLFSPLSSSRNERSEKKTTHKTYRHYNRTSERNNKEEYKKQAKDYWRTWVFLFCSSIQHGWNKKTIWTITKMVNMEGEKLTSTPMNEMVIQYENVLTKAQRIDGLFLKKRRKKKRKRNTQILCLPVFFSFCSHDI